jgi:hypothetical protein
MSKIDISSKKVSKKIILRCLFKMNMSKIDIIRFIPLMDSFPVPVPVLSPVVLPP